MRRLCCLLLLPMLALLAGCDVLRGTPAPKRVYINTARLVPLHPGYAALRQLDQQYRDLAAYAGAPVDVPPLPVPPPLTMPTASRTPTDANAPGAGAAAFIEQTKRTSESYLGALRSELAEARDRRIEQRRLELMTALDQEMRTEQARSDDARWQSEQQAAKQFQGRLFNARAALAVRHLKPEEKTRLESELRAVQGQLDAAIAGVRREARLALEATRAGKMRAVEQALAQYESELRTADDAVIASRQAAINAEFTEAAGRLQFRHDPPPAAPPKTVSSPESGPDAAALSRGLNVQRTRARVSARRAQTALLADVAALKAARGRMLAALSDEVEAALSETGADHGVEVSSDRRLPDYTARAAMWLRSYWAEPGDSSRR